MCQPNVSDPSIKEFSDRIIRIQKLKIALAADIIKEEVTGKTENFLNSSLNGSAGIASSSSEAITSHRKPTPIDPAKPAAGG